MFDLLFFYFFRFDCGLIYEAKYSLMSLHKITLFLVHKFSEQMFVVDLNFTDSFLVLHKSCFFSH